jgi:hypothetical protein
LVGRGGNATASPSAIAVSRVLGYLANLPLLRNGSGNDNVPPYDALRRLLLMKHAMGRALAPNLVAIVPPNPGIIVNLLELVIFFNVPRCHCLQWHSLSFPSLSSSSSAVAAIARNHLCCHAIKTLLELVGILKSALHALCLLGESNDVCLMRQLLWQ